MVEKLNIVGVKGNDVTMPKGFKAENIEHDGFLPDKRAIVIKIGKGRHLKAAQDLLGEDDNQRTYAELLAIRLCAIDPVPQNEKEPEKQNQYDFQPIQLENFEEMSLVDVSAIHNYFLEKLALAGITSSISSPKARVR